ncbi:MAG: transketolase family protein, partial [Treponema sp.]|nr:transketolase family protein [Treponema sp.]
MNIKSTREAVVSSIMEAAQKDEKIIVVSSDSVLAGRLTPFIEKYPKRIIEAGIAEQSAVNIAAGLA